MLKYTIRRLLIMIPVLFGVTIVISSLIYFSPGNPAQLALGQGADAQAVQQLEREMGLHQPVYIRYFYWLESAVHGDFGESLQNGRSVTDLMLSRAPATLELVLSSMAIMLVVALPLGVLSAVKQYSWVDNASMLFALFWISMPSFWLGLILIMLFSVRWGIFPISGRSGGVLSLTALSFLALPAIANGARRAGILTRMTRGAMLEVLNEDYIRTARGKGIGEKGVIYTHAMKNAMIPVITIIGLQVPTLVSASVIIEIVFAWPGMGRLLVDAVFQRDYPVVQGVVLMYAILVMIANLIVDLLYSYFDPRIQYD
ncbi:ABC transporter permease [Natronosalvus halobius]|uniref:ABC transporter permease n=1 Tax=Natronosalvus halobius TaxID=2953746 RepID=UPI0020A1468A|nr:ABC transporter permease [Natronosalvus halobius]USZ73665.1 ABC transporter permease [Natronosalvus halobius]